MYYSWLDAREEMRAQEGEQYKVPTTVTLNTELAFPLAEKSEDLSVFEKLASEATKEPLFFERETKAVDDVNHEGSWLRFQSDVTTGIVENNTVCARITESRKKDKVLVVLNHWNATKWQDKISKLFPLLGITVVELALPYHFDRKRRGSHYADYMVSANLGRTIQSFRQGVLDSRKLIDWLKEQGYGEISVLGMSLGSVIAGLLAAHDPRVSKLSLFLTAGDVADVVWTGRATRAIRKSLEGQLELPQLKKAWQTISLENYVDGLARSDLDVEVVLAKRDNVMLPAISQSLLNKFDAAGVQYRATSLNCGHYTLGMTQYTAIAGLKLLHQLLAR